MDERASHLIYETDEINLGCKHCGTSWGEHIGEDFDGRRNVCPVPPRPTPPPAQRDPELQEAVESLLWSLGERTRCAVCYRFHTQGHTKNCRIGKLHAILNSRVPRVAPPHSAGEPR